MPTYEYICQKCSTLFSVSGDYKTLFGLKPYCPKCKGEDVTKKISLFDFILKGTGFYSTDNKK